MLSNQSLLQDGSWPQFTECFQLTLLVWVPCAWLWLTLPIYLHYLLKRDDNIVPIASNYYNLSKNFLGLVLAILSVIDLIQLASKETNYDDSVPNAAYVASALQAATYLLTVVLVQLEKRRGFVTSGVLFIFWSLSTAAGVIPFYSKIIQKEYNDDLFTFVLFYIHYGCIFIEFLLQFKAENVQCREGYTKVGESVNPQVYSSFLSRLTFWWVNSIILHGYKKELTVEDVPQLRPWDKSRSIVPLFEKFWNHEVKECKKTAIAQSASCNVDIGEQCNSNNTEKLQDANERTPLLGHTSGTSSVDGEPQDEVRVAGQKTEKDTKSPSLFKVLVKTFWFQMLQAYLCRFSQDASQFAIPLLLNVLIGYVQHKGTEAAWNGYVYAGAFFAVSVLCTCFEQQSNQLLSVLNMRIKSVLMAAVYRKALTMDNDTKKSSAVGEIVNLMSVDCERISGVATFSWAVWSCPMQIIISLVLLYNLLGLPVFAGVAIMVLVMPCTAVLTKKQRNCQLEQMKLKDARLKLMNEVLNGIKVLKLYAWEPSFQKKISDIRNQELRVLKKNAYLGAIGGFIWTSAPFLVTLLTFTTYILVTPGHYLDAQHAFVALSLFNILRWPMIALPHVVNAFVQAHVSMSRVRKFLNSGDLDPDNVQKNIKPDLALSVEKGTFTWDRKLPPVLQDINLEIPRGKLFAVVGQVGAGKSSLMSAFLGELEKVNGSVNINGSTAYVAQQAWIQNATLQDNILFSADMNKSRYDKVIEACALKTDLEILPGGDLTEIGEKGINLSGGQKQRVSLARAVYNDADIYLLDDPLSAVDSHVGKHIFDEVLGEKGMLREKTRILVTHGVHWLPMVDTVVVIVDGKISEIGSYEELLSHDGDFAQFLKNYLRHDSEESDDEESDPEIIEIRSRILQRVDSVISEDGDTDLSKKRTVFKRQRSRKESERSLKESEQENKIKASEKLIEEEIAESGTVKMGVYFAYAKAVGFRASTVIVLLTFIYKGLPLLSNIWLSNWTSDPYLMNTSLSNTSEYSAKNSMYLGVYGAVSSGEVIFVLIHSIFSSIVMIKAARALHEKMLDNVLKSPMSFFDTTPIGRIVNRFSKDVETIDNGLPGCARHFVNCLVEVLFAFVAITYSTPIFIAVMVPLGVLYYLIQKFYIPTARQLRRVGSNARSPIFVHFSETITGASTIRAFNAADRFIEQNDAKLDNCLKFQYTGSSTNAWLSVRLEFLGQLIILAAAMFAVLTPDISGGVVGLSISYATQVTGCLFGAVRMITELETNIVSVERVEEYAKRPTEADWTDPKHKPDPEWPQHGKVNFVNYKTRYRSGLDLVLKGITAEIKGSEKVGIVGRTGAGKSSLTVALFRLIESTSGSIIIDGETIANMGLHDLRSKLTILPQDPIVFCGTLRMNLDPFDEYTDEQLWMALENCHLKNFVSKLPEELGYECGEGGSNLSVGQRQLLCLGRSLLRKTKILILDEATAAVDMETDDVIQKTIRSEFKDCTVLTIAHRLNTVLDYDKILLLDKGRISEFDSPDNLLKDKSSQFYSMCKDANLVS